MKTGISVVICRFVEHHIVADDPFAERSWLDEQDMPRVLEQTGVAVVGLPVDPLPPLPGVLPGFGRHSQKLRRRLRELRRRLRAHNAVTRRGDGA